MPDGAKIKAILDRNVSRTNKKLKQPIKPLKKGQQQSQLPLAAGAGALMLLFSSCFAMLIIRKRKR